MRKSMLTVMVPIVALLAAACGSSSSKTSTSHTTKSTTTSASSAAGKVTIATRTIKPYGTVLVNSAGHAIYVFAPDKAKKVTCVSACAKIWPPVKLSSGAKAAGSGQVKASLLGSDSDPSGGNVATYNGWPLYTYVTDTAPGVAHGQGLKLSGGYWYLMAPSGTVVKTKKSSSSKPSSPYG